MGLVNADFSALLLKGRIPQIPQVAMKHRKPDMMTAKTIVLGDKRWHAVNDSWYRATIILAHLRRLMGIDGSQRQPWVSCFSFKMLP